MKQICLFLLFCMFSTFIFAQEYLDQGDLIQGWLEEDDETLSDDSFFDTYFYEGRENEEISIVMESWDFDTYLILVTEEEEVKVNDDGEGMGTDSLLTYEFSENEMIEIYATSYDPETTGEYTLYLESEESASMEDKDASAVRETVSEALDGGDESMDSGEYYDAYPFTAEEGQLLSIDLTSDDFDTYLIVSGPDDFQVDVDDSNGTSNSSLEQFLETSGDYVIYVTSYAAEESGDYNLAYRVMYENQQDFVSEGTGTIDLDSSSDSIEGELGTTEQTLNYGQYFDVYVFEGARGDEVEIELSSEDFDTYLMVESPSGNREVENDDASGETTNSGVEFILAETGRYSVIASSYSAGFTGAYLIESSKALSPMDIDLSTTDAVETEEEETEVAEVAEGSTEITSRLTSSDGPLDSGEYFDSYSFYGERGQEVSIKMMSDEVDTFLMLNQASGYVQETNDDGPVGTNSELNTVLTASGEYFVIATTYGIGETGSYSIESSVPLIEVEREETQPSSASSSSSSSNTEIASFTGKTTPYYGLFVGISDYPYEGNDLDYCREDAVKLAEAFRNSGIMAAEQQIVLEDDEATTDNIRQAILDIAANMEDNDTLFFFYSGHGSTESGTSTARNERDSNDESIFVYDDSILDDEMADILEAVPGKVALVFDSCFAAGFAKDVITEPGWYGIFSSEEDIMSLVASQFQAGGYLSHYILQAIEGAADGALDGWQDKVITIGELERYLFTSYYDEETGVPADSSQHLVFDRNGVDINEQLFFLE